MIRAWCGGAPGSSREVDEEFWNRSPLSVLQHATDVQLDIAAGVRDGRDGSVPIHHSLRAFNVVAARNQSAEIPIWQMDELWKQGSLPDPPLENVNDQQEFYRKILFRRVSGKCRVTIFDGGHEGLPHAACNWLAMQQRQTNSAANEPRRPRTKEGQK